MVGGWPGHLCCLVELPLTLALSPKGRGDWFGAALGYAFARLVSWLIALREQARSYKLFRSAQASPTSFREQGLGAPKSALFSTHSV